MVTSLGRRHWIAGLLVVGGVLTGGVVGLDWVAQPHPQVIRDTLSATGPQIVLSREIDRLHASFIRAGVLYGVEDHFVYASTDSGATFRRIGVIPKIDPSLPEMIENFVARRGVTRLIRRSAGAVNLIVLASGTVLVFYDRMYRMEAGTTQFQPVEAPRIADVFLGGIAIGPGDTVYQGEYITGARPTAPRILRGTEDGTHWEVAYTFPSGEIFHVHSVTYDPHRNGYWVATGDQDQEVGLWFTADNFRTLEKVGGGTQDWRVVALIVREHELIWGSDDDQGPAAIFRWNVDDRRLTKLQVTQNPSYYAGQLSDGTMVITTTYEPESSFSRSAGGPYPYTSIWVSRDGDRWTEALRLDEQPTVASGRRARPQIRLPAGDASLPQLFATPVWTTTHSLSTLGLRITW